MSNLGILVCPVCACPTQRTPKGTPLDGLREHEAIVHPDQVTDESELSI